MEVIMMKKKEFKYGEPISPEEMPKPRRRLPQYDECLREFLRSGYDYWKVNLDSLPSKDPKVVLSSLKWRVKHKKEFKNIRVIMHNGKIFLERIR